MMKKREIRVHQICLLISKSYYVVTFQYWHSSTALFNLLNKYLFFICSIDYKTTLFILSWQNPHVRKTWVNKAIWSAVNPPVSPVCCCQVLLSGSEKKQKQYWNKLSFDPSWTCKRTQHSFIKKFAINIWRIIISMCEYATL